MFRTRTRTAVASLAVAGALGLVVAARWSENRKDRREILARPRRDGLLNVVLITADTLGADMLGCYGNREIETPHLDQLAKSGILFENATTVAPLTLPAHTSILTGTYPMSHGVRDNVGFYVKPNQVTLAGTLKAAGYATGAFVGAFVLDARWGLNQGFDRYVDDFDLSKAEVISPDMARHRGEDVLSHALQWVADTKQKPFFAWIHFYDPHGPYDPPEPYRTRYGSRPWGLYQGEVAHVDALVGQLLDWLDQNGLSDRTVIAFVGDHGESLGRHGENSHGVLVYDATLHVPLILRAPGNAARGRVNGQVRSIDLAPTLLDLLGVPVPPIVQGRSLVGVTTARVAYSESFNAKFEYGWSELRSLHTDSFHFIDAPRQELYDIRSDPDEQNNLAGSRPEVLRQFEHELAGLVAQDRTTSRDGQVPGVIDEASRQRLASLGYIGGRAPADRGRAPANPKDKIGLANLIKEAEADLVAGRLEAAAEKTGAVIGSDPDTLAAYNILGNVHLKKGEPAKALGAYQQALTKNPDYQPALFNVAAAYYKLHQPRAAAAAWQHLLELDPRDTDVLLRLGQVAAETGDREKATALFDQVLSVKPESAEAEEGLGTVALSNGDLQSAETHLTRAAGMNPTLVDVHYNLGMVFHGRGDLTRAEHEYRREVEAHPANVKAHHYLGLVYAQTDNFAGQLAEFQTVVRLDPNVAQAHFLLADALLQKNELTAALDHVERAIKLDPNPESPYLVLAAIEDKLGNQAAKERALAMARSRRSQR
jgi:arylsulfatase A-like enzyme/tetratricopeptide (TPR) repeat protein